MGATLHRGAGTKKNKNRAQFPLERKHSRPCEQGMGGSEVAFFVKPSFGGDMVVNGMQRSA